MGNCSRVEKKSKKKKMEMRNGRGMSRGDDALLIEFRVPVFETTLMRGHSC